MAGQHLQFFVALGIADARLQQKAIELALRQRIGSFEFEGILRRNDHERPRQPIGMAIDRDLTVAHRFQKRNLRARRRAVDFIGQHDVGEDRPLAEKELAGLRVEDARPDDIPGQQVRRELNATEASVNALGERLPTSVLPTPGTSSRRTCSPDKRKAARDRRMTRGLPSTTLAILASSSPTRLCNSGDIGQSTLGVFRPATQRKMSRPPRSGICATRHRHVQAATPANTFMLAAGNRAGPPPWPVHGR